MPDLSTPGIHRFWKNYEDPMIYRVVSFMESVESWTLDGNGDLEAAIAELSRQLDDISQLDLEDFGHQDAFIQLANVIKTGRALRLLQILDIAHPGSASKLLMYAESNSRNPDDMPGMFLRRNIVFERLRLLARVCASTRLNLILKALEGEDNA